MNPTHSPYLPFSRRQLKIQGLLWLGIALELSLMVLLVREVRPGPLPETSGGTYPEMVAGGEMPVSSSPLLAQEKHRAR